MKLFGKQAEIEMMTASGTLRVSVTPTRNWLLMLFETAGLAWFASLAIRDWRTLPILFRAALVWIEAAAVAGILYQLSGSEVIEFSAEALTIAKTTFAWTRRREYATGQCNELEYHEESKRGHSGLRCKVGWRTVGFAEYISEAQGAEILAALQRDLPDVARKMGLMLPAKASLMTLGLNK